MHDLMRIELLSPYAPGIEAVVEPRSSRGGHLHARRPTRRWKDAWQDARGVLLILAALALWAMALTGVVAPLGDMLARIDAARAPAASADARR